MQVLDGVDLELRMVMSDDQGWLECQQELLALLAGAEGSAAPMTAQDTVAKPDSFYRKPRGVSVPGLFHNQT